MLTASLRQRNGGRAPAPVVFFRRRVTPPVLPLRPRPERGRSPWPRDAMTAPARRFLLDQD